MDTDLLLVEALSLNYSTLDILEAVELNLEQEAHFKRLLERRMAGEPIAYITRSKAFWTIEVQVTPQTLVPRPETELVVERTLHHCRSRIRPVIADLGTGSGCIAIALATERAEASIVATDLSADALQVAEQNSKAQKLDNIRFRQGDWVNALPNRQFDIIAANPPYIADDDPCLEDRLMRFEPRLALEGGSDGLEAIRNIVLNAGKHLKLGGWLIVEHGYNQGRAVRRLFRNAQLEECRTFTDLAGLDRVTEGCKTEQAQASTTVNLQIQP